MKLLTKTGIYYLVITLLLFAIGGSVFYFSLQNIINESVTEHLYTVKEQVIAYTKKTGAIPSPSPILTDIVNFSPSVYAVKEELRDTMIIDPDDEEYEPYRNLIFSVNAGGINYKASIIKPLVESDDLIESIAYSLIILAGILLVVLFIVNWRLSKRMWKPFYKTLDSLSKFDLNSTEVLSFPQVKTAEFSLLNLEIQKMTEKIRQDYRNLKEFTENASHEIQTPLAIIRSKLELMAQSEHIPQNQMKPVQDIYESVNRLSKLNQSLLLLAKIENRQFHEEENINLINLVEKKLEQFDDMIAFKNISVQKNLSDVSVKMNAHLADILISNIISNAIRHNLSGGKITVEIKNHLLSVSNTGSHPEVPTEKLFERFQKGTASNESAGLGLSIVKQICDTCNFRVSYSCKDEIHAVVINFK